ncbi:hypothetical protein BN1110_01471 [bacterium YEK0313]|nr:hypothetical protein BN1110_01471 [bacterium YEK0313]
MASLDHDRHVCKTHPDLAAAKLSRGSIDRCDAVQD